MKTEVKKIDATTRELNVEASGDVVKNKFEDVFTRVGKEAKVPGFRPGHAPRDMLEKHYGAQVHDEVLKELVPDIYNEAINKEGLDVIELPEITEVKLDGMTLSFKAKVEISPEIKLNDYKGIKVEYKKISISPDEVKRSLDAIKESRKIEAIDDGFAKSCGYPNVQELESAIERQLFLQKENNERAKIENEIVDTLAKGVEFKVPQSLIERQLQDLVRQTKVDLAMKGMPRDKIDAEEEAITKDLRPQAEKQVRIYLLLTEVAKKEKIAIDDNMPRKVLEFLLKEANWKQAA